MRDLAIANCKNIIVKIYVIGYSKRGESIIFLLKDRITDDVIYSIAIDSFKYKKCNKTKDILSSVGIKVLDVFCWSHPDIDHTFGIEDIFNNFCVDRKTRVVIPFAFSDPNFSNFKFNRRDKDYLDYLLQQNCLNGQFCITSGPAPFQDMGIDKFRLVDSLDSVIVKVYTLSPHSSYINSLLTSNGYIDKNKLSIVMCVSVNAYNFIFCSDIENDSISFLDADYFSDPLFLKIPHHGSPTSSDLLTLLQNTKHNMACCTTIYKQHKIPNKNIIKKYQSVCERIDSTGSNMNSDFGIVEYSFDLFDKCDCKVIYSGHACNLYC
jgi:hypothetical protein